ncbi:Rab proteins geranylgeranyltransferase component A [Grifola frondosa]|uniref:Rab proteins geranylgeranyltransferase component A n=1 Tax=Grifola frondosa TaxID=5627 RepID=A0A1C7LR32_GRIFR|nr:Rab proteins geranylgeranyltransferase component A [Grifola frondosa]
MDFDAVVLGTGLSESITAAALSKAGFKVAHIDSNQYYGGDDASLTLDELMEWADQRASIPDDKAPSDFLARQRARFTSITHSSTLPTQSRQYSISLAPSIIPSIGPLIDSLIASGVSRYGNFKLLEKVAIYDRPGGVKSVPGSKEDVFKSKVLSLVDKRRLMRFLMFAAGEFEGKTELEGKEQLPFLQFLHDVFSLDDQAASAIAYALAFCMSASDTTLPALQRIRQYLRSAGRYGASPFLVGHYGGLGEIAQGFCRTSAVKGGTYILGRRISSIAPFVKQEDSSSSAHETSLRPSRYAVELEDFAEQLNCDLVICSSDYAPPTAVTTVPPSPLNARQVFPVARCVAIIDRPISFSPAEPSAESSAPPPVDADAPSEAPGEPPAVESSNPNYEVDTGLLVFPPSSFEGASAITTAHVLVTGEGSLSAPKGKYILYISMPLIDASPQSAAALLTPYLDATLTLAIEKPGEASPINPLFTLFYIQHPPAPATAATTMHPDILAVEVLKASGHLRDSGVERDTQAEGREKDEATALEVDAFWPPLDSVDDETVDDW